MAAWAVLSYAARRTSLPSEVRTALLFLIAACTAFFLFVAPIPQDASYHYFADRRGFRCGCGAGGFTAQGGRGRLVLPNFGDVASNVVILVGGLAGLCVALRADDLRLAGAGSWHMTVCLPTFFGGTAATAAGSAFYHWRPSNDTLVWDRLPMTVAFVAIFCFLMDEYLPGVVGAEALLPLLVVGVSSVIYWHFTDDLRPYALVQFVPLLAAPFLMAAYHAKFTGQEYQLVALFLYALAKICEAKDHEIFVRSCQTVSGHTLKHILAGLVPISIAYMLLSRQPL